MNELAELKKIVFDLKADFEMFKITMPKWFSLGDVSHEIDRSRDTIRKYLKSNFVQMNKEELWFKNSSQSILDDIQSGDMDEDESKELVNEIKSIQKSEASQKNEFGFVEEE